MTRKDYTRAARIVAEIEDVKTRNMVGSYFRLLFGTEEGASFDDARFCRAANINLHPVTMQKTPEAN